MGRHGDRGNTIGYPCHAITKSFVIVRRIYYHRVFGNRPAKRMTSTIKGKPLPRHRRGEDNKNENIPNHGTYLFLPLEYKPHVRKQSPNRTVQFATEACWRLNRGLI